jgi:hypothetical protein
VLNIQKHLKYEMHAIITKTYDTQQNLIAATYNTK